MIVTTYTDEVPDKLKGPLTLYTNHSCPWAQRAHIVLQELGIPYNQVIIDLERPRDEWYLKINKRGLVPTIQHKDSSFSSSEPMTVIESGLVVQYLLDAYPGVSSHLRPQTKNPKTAYDQYMINLLTDTFMTKVNPLWMPAMLAAGTDQAEPKADAVFEAVKTHFEPLLAASLFEGKGPFAGGAERFTLLEILVAPFVLRINDFSNGQILPTSLLQKLNSLPVYSEWSKAVIECKSVTYTWDKEHNISTILKRLPDFRKKYGAK